MIDPLRPRGASYHPLLRFLTASPNTWFDALLGDVSFLLHELVHHRSFVGPVDVDYPYSMRDRFVALAPPKVSRWERACREFGWPNCAAFREAYFDSGDDSPSIPFNELDAWKQQAENEAALLEDLERRLSGNGPQDEIWSKLTPRDVELIFYPYRASLFALVFAEALSRSHATALQTLQTVPETVRVDRDYDSVRIYYGEKGLGKREGERKVYLSRASRSSSAASVWIGVPQKGSPSGRITLDIPSVDFDDLMGDDDRVWSRAQPIIEDVLQDRLDRYTQDIVELRELDEWQRVLKERLRRRLNELVEAAR